MKKIFFCLALLISLSANTSLQAMAMPLTQEELQILSEACQAHPYICYPLLAAQTVCCTLLVGTLIVKAAKEYGTPALASCFSCCTRKKQQKEDQLANHLLIEIDPNLSQGKKRKLIAMAILKEELPDISNKDRKAVQALLQQHQWDPAKALAAAQRKKDTNAVKLLKQLK